MKHISTIPKCNTCSHRDNKMGNTWCNFYDQYIPDMFFYFCSNHKPKQ